MEGGMTRGHDGALGVMGMSTVLVVVMASRCIHMSKLNVHFKHSVYCV